MADFDAPPAHTEILLPLGGKHILSPKPLDGHLGNRRISETFIVGTGSYYWEREVDYMSLRAPLDINDVSLNPEIGRNYLTGRTQRSNLQTPNTCWD